MTVKRRSHGRNKKGRGHVNRVRCASTGKAIPKDKAIKRFIVRNIVDASSMRDIRDASAFETYALPKIYIKQYYSVEAAIHQRVVRVRSREGRKNREPPLTASMRLCRPSTRHLTGAGLRHRVHLPPRASSAAVITARRDATDADEGKTITHYFFASARAASPWAGS